MQSPACHRPQNSSDELPAWHEMEDTQSQQMDGELSGVFSNYKDRASRDPQKINVGMNATSPKRKKYIQILFFYYYYFFYG